MCGGVEAQLLAGRGGGVEHEAPVVAATTSFKAFGFAAGYGFAAKLAFEAFEFVVEGFEPVFGWTVT